VASASAKTKAYRIGRTNFMQFPTLIVCLKRQGFELSYFRFGISIANGLIDPARTNFDMGEVLACELKALCFRQGQDLVANSGIESLQTFKLFDFSTVQIEEWDFECQPDFRHSQKGSKIEAKMQDLLLSFSCLTRFHYHPSFDAALHHQPSSRYGWS